MIVQVELLANNPPEWDNPRLVDVPDEEIDSEIDPVGHLLSLIFHYGQNDIQQRNCCSVSVGDVAHVDGRFFLCQPFGWKEITEKELEEYRTIPQRDRPFSKFVRP